LAVSPGAASFPVPILISIYFSTEIIAAIFSPVQHPGNISRKKRKEKIPAYLSRNTFLMLYELIPS
jgi:hypothetical protein